MIPARARVLVAVSGGVDSMVLLDVLAQLSLELNFELILGHINHGLRGNASARDMAFVQDAAIRYKRHLICHELAPADLEAYASQGREGAARNARFAALKQIASEAGAIRIALGHNRDDHAETILYHLARGAGPTGLRGIAPVRLPFIRPLLRTSRKQILVYATDQSLPWREDATNADCSFDRNRIRHHVMPELRALNPRIDEALARNADLLADLDRATTYLVEEKVTQWILDSKDNELSWSRSQLTQLPAPVLQLVLREAIRQARGDLNGISFAHIDTVIDLINGVRAHAELSLPRTRVRLQRDRFSLLSDPPPVTPCWNLPVGLGKTQLPHGMGNIALDIVPIADVDFESIRGNRWVEVADADTVTFPLHLRTRLPGDRFTPLGLDQEIKLKDFLINEHAPYFTRDGIPLLCDERGILWVAGIRLSDTVKLSDRTQRVLIMTLKGVR